MDLSKAGGVQVMFMQFLALAVRWDSFVHYVYALRITEERKDELRRVGVRCYFPRWNGDYDLWNRLRIASVIRRESTDYVWGQNFTGNLWAAVARLLSFSRVTLLTHEHGSSWNVRGIRLILSKFWALLSDRILCNSSAAACVVSQRLKVKAPISVVRNGVRAEPCCPEGRLRQIIRTELGFRGNEQVAMFVGRLEYLKGVHTLIAAAKLVARELPTVRFLIVGSGSMEQELKERLKVASICEKVRFLGFRSDAAQLMSVSDMVVLPSIREPFGNVLVEAGFARRPVIATKVDGVVEIVEDGKSGILLDPTVAVSKKARKRLPRYVYHPGSGRLVSPRELDPARLAESIIFLARNPLLAAKMGDYAYQLVSARLSIDQYAGRLRKLFN